MIDDSKEKAITKPITEPEVTDIDLGFVEKKKFRINGDYDRMLELNVSDLNIFKRYTETEPKLQKLLEESQKKVAEVNAISKDDEDSIEKLSKMADVLDDIDKEMRKLMNYLFDSNVSEVCAPSGNMFDPVGGEYRYEKIIIKLAELYTTGLLKEIEQFKKKSSKYTNKYTKKYHK